MNLDEATRALMAMYGDGDTAHDAAFKARDASPGGIGIRDMPEFPPTESHSKGPFVDRINDDGMAVLLMPDGSTSEIPASRLPRGTHEGAYLGPNGVDDLLGMKKTAGDARKKLSAGDDGGDLKL